MSCAHTTNLGVHLDLDTLLFQAHAWSCGTLIPLQLFLSHQGTCRWYQSPRWEIQDEQAYKEERRLKDTQMRLDHAELEEPVCLQLTTSLNPSKDI